MREYDLYINQKITLLVIPRSAEGVTWGPSFICAKLRIKKMNMKILKNLLIYPGSPRPPAGGLGMRGTWNYIE
jgi:hypothetical protein